MDLPFADAVVYGIVRALAARRPVIPVDAWEASAPERVLLVLTTGLGDAVLSTPVFPALRSAYPGAELRLLIRESWSPLFFSDPDLDGIIPYHGKYRRYFHTLRTLRLFAPDLAVILHGNDPDIAPLCYFAGSQRIVRIPTRGTRYGFLLSNASREMDQSTVEGLHYIDNRLRVLDTLGLKPVSRVPRIVLDTAFVERVRSRLAKVIGDGPYWVLHPAAADAYKTWPEHRARALLEAYSTMRVVLSGASGDRSRLLRIARGLPHAAVLAGELHVGELAVLLAGAHCVVAPDTGVLHLAAALDTPTIGLYAPTSAALVGARPRSPESRILQKPRTCSPCTEKRCPFTPRNCMDQITEEEVLGALRSALPGAK